MQRIIFNRLRRSSLFLTAASILLAFSLTHPSFADEHPLLQIIDPPDGITVHPGQTIRVSVAFTDQTVAFKQVMIVGDGPIGFSSAITKPPFIFTITIPTLISSRQYFLTASGITTSGSGADSDPIAINVERAESPSALTAHPSPLLLDYVGDQSQILVNALLQGQSPVDVTYSGTISYATGDPGIATVSKSGLVTASGAGTTNILIKYNSASFNVQVTVPKPTIRGDLDHDGTVDLDDLNILLSWVNHPVSGPVDARDLNHDGKIDERDVEIMKTLIAEQNEKNKRREEERREQERAKNNSH